MFFASIGDVKRCSILIQTALQLYSCEVRSAQDIHLDASAIMTTAICQARLCYNSK